MPMQSFQIQKKSYCEYRAHHFMNIAKYIFSKTFINIFIPEIQQQYKKI